MEAQLRTEGTGDTAFLFLVKNVLFAELPIQAEGWEGSFSPSEIHGYPLLILLLPY